MLRFFEAEAPRWVRLGRDSGIYPIPEISSTGFRLSFPVHLTSNEVVVVMRAGFDELKNQIDRGSFFKSLPASQDRISDCFICPIDE
jgi:hypothetical protein